MLTYCCCSVCLGKQMWYVINALFFFYFCTLQSYFNLLHVILQLMGAYLSHLALENTVSDLVVKYLPLLNVTDIMAGKFCSERNAPVHFANPIIFDNTDIAISMNSIGGNHWTFVAIEIKNACFVYMDPKGDLYTGLTACHKYCQMWQVFSTVFNREHGSKTRLPTSYSSTVFLHARQPVNDLNNCGIYILMVHNTHSLF